MNQYYSIQGGRRLEGTVTISGAKNAAVAIIPAAVLAGECCILENLPAIQDVQTLKHILSRMGAQVDFTRGDCMRVDPKPITTVDATFPEVSAMRASYYLLGAMLGAYGEVELEEGSRFNAVVRGITKKKRRELLDKLPVSCHASIYQRDGFKTVVFDLDEE